MSLIKTLNLIVSSVLAVAFLVGCRSEADQLQDPGAGLANPASIYCQGLGFEEETRESELGQHGVCIFSDGSECDTWDFLAGRIWAATPLIGF